MITQQVMDVAESVARKTAADWPHMDADDIRQEILLVACTRADEYNAMHEGELHVSLTREAVAYCARERNEYVYRTARYLYTTQEVRALLAIAVESVGVLADAATKDSYVAAPDAGNVCVSMWDLHEALTAIKPEWRKVLARQAEGDSYGKGEGSDRLRDSARGYGWKPLTKSEQRTALRALDRLTEVLNRQVNRTPGEHEGPGAREAISSTRAQAVTHAERDGE